MKNLRPIIILSALISFIGIALAAFFMFMGPDRMQVAGKSIADLLEGGELLGILAIPFVLVITAVVMWSVFRTVSPPKIKNGVTAPARVLEVQDTGVSVNDNPQVKLMVEVIPQSGSPFQAEVKTLVSRLNAALVQPGITAEVIYDPLNPARIQLNNLELKPVELNNAENRLRELERLYDEGLITGEEYRTKREEILKSI